MNLKESKEVIVSSLDDLGRSKDKILDKVSRKHNQLAKSIINSIDMCLRNIIDYFDSLITMQELQESKKGK